MIVFCVFQRFECIIQKPNGEKDTLEYETLECIKFSNKKAQEYINEQPPEIRPRLHTQVWNVE